MDFLKINFFFYLYNWLRLLLIVCGDRESNPGPDSEKRVHVRAYNIRGFHTNLDELALAGLGYDVFVCAEAKSLIAAISQSYVSLDLVAPNRGRGTPHLVPGYGSLC